jgi:signal transduction histidine kinase
MTSIGLNRSTPIQPILGLSEIISPKVNVEDREYVYDIVRNARRLHRLTKEILDVTKIESLCGGFMKGHML